MPGVADMPDRHEQLELPQPQERPERDQPARQSITQLQHRLDRLPDGHPSSPYREDGSHRAPTVRLKDLELPEEDPSGTSLEAVDTSVSTENGASDKWREALPAFEAAWRDHLERWPEEERPPIDRSTDELGSWRGDGGQYLNVEENIVTEHARDRVIEAAPQVTEIVQSAEADTFGARLVGLDHCIKGADRFKEKVADGLALKPERAVGRVTSAIPDALRYTFQFTGENYTSGYRAVCEKLQERGCEPVLSRNSWESPDYKGVNSRWRTESGLLFEVQFHTGESFEAKEVTHMAYERLRNPTTDKAETRDLEQYQRLVAGMIPIPERVDEINDIDRRNS
ncbi:MAG: hypothetical protein ABJB47_01450 [Actinomycetota bacterium]